MLVAHKIMPELGLKNDSFVPFFCGVKTRSYKILQKLYARERLFCWWGEREEGDGRKER